MVFKHLLGVHEFSRPVGHEFEEVNCRLRCRDQRRIGHDLEGILDARGCYFRRNVAGFPGGIPNLAASFAERGSGLRREQLAALGLLGPVSLQIRPTPLLLRGHRADFLGGFGHIYGAREPLMAKAGKAALLAGATAAGHKLIGLLCGI